MKPFTVALALDTNRVTPEHDLSDFARCDGRRPGVDPRLAPAGVLSVAQMIEKSSNIGTTKIPSSCRARGNVEHVYDGRLRQSPQFAFPARSRAACAVQELAADRAGHHVAMVTAFRFADPDWRAPIRFLRTTAT